MKLHFQCYYDPDGLQVLPVLCVRSMPVEGHPDRDNCLGVTVSWFFWGVHLILL
jgi:hypothetical protein